MSLVDWISAFIIQKERCKHAQRTSRGQRPGPTSTQEAKTYCQNDACTKEVLIVIERGDRQECCGTTTA
jgi:hypothetical protein